MSRFRRSLVPSCAAAVAAAAAAWPAHGGRLLPSCALLQADPHLPIDMLRLVLRALIGDEPLEAYRLCRHLQVWLGCCA